MIAKNKIIIGKVLKEARVNKKMTQLELAQRIGISRSYLADLESGRYAPSSEKLLLLSKALEIDINSLKKRIK